MRLLTLAILFLSFFYLASAARKIEPNTVDTPSKSRDYLYVCHPHRFSDMGLNIKDFAYCDASLPYDVRVKDLIDRMTMEEKVQQIWDTTPGVERIGLPRYEWWSEALHGVSNVGPWWNSHATFFDSVVPAATSFPTPITTASTFNESLWRLIGRAVSTEARAMYNLGRAGLTFWSPNINVVRDPRWGRAMETPGEDPFTVGKYAVNYVRGLQDIEGKENATDPNNRPLNVAACCKHYAAYDVDNWLGVVRETFDARVTEQDMAETFVQPFEMCVKEGDVASVMCSYNRVNGIPACADPKLLKDTIRGEWDLHGYIVSDCDSVEVMVDRHHWLSDSMEDAVAQSLKAGLDLDCGDSYGKHAGSAIKQGLVKEAEVDRALTNLYTVLMRVGFFDGHPEFNKLGKNSICSPEHIHLAAQAAREGVVLLKNEGDTLPLNNKQIKTLAVIGPHADATDVMIGNYAGIPCRYTRPIDALSKYVKKVNYQPGCKDVFCVDDKSIFPALEAAKNSDATVIVAGISLGIEAESRDRVDLLLPGYQTQLINQVAETSKGPVILVLMSAGGLDITFAKNNPKIKAILWVGYPGQEGGQGMADVIFGKYNPDGRLPLTWHENSYVDQIPMTSMPLRPVESLGYPGRTYKFFQGPTVYTFGFGLSYTTWDFSPVAPQRSIDIPLNKFQHCHAINSTAPARTMCPAVHVDDINCEDTYFEFNVDVQNTGKVDGSKVVMVFSAAPKGTVEAPIRQMVGFKKVFVEAGKTQMVPFRLNACRDLGIVDYAGYKVLPAGQHTIILGTWISTFPFTINLKPKN